MLYKGLLRYSERYGPGRDCASMTYAHAHVTRLTPSLNTPDINIYIPRKSPKTGWMSKRTKRIRDDPDIDDIALGLLSLLIRNHTIPYLFHTSL